MMPWTLTWRQGTTTAVHAAADELCRPSFEFALECATRCASDLRKQLTESLLYSVFLLDGTLGKPLKFVVHMPIDLKTTETSLEGPKYPRGRQ
jgi:hypothetical protein